MRTEHQVFYFRLKRKSKQEAGNGSVFYIFTFSFLSILLFCINTFKLQAEVEWASKLLGFSSEYDYRMCSAKEVLGKPSVFKTYKPTACAWTTQYERSNDQEWIFVGFDNPLFCEQIAVHEVSNPGAISKIYVYFEDDSQKLVYENTTFPYIDVPGRMLNVFFEKTQKKVKSVKLFLQTSRIPGFSYIDAIGISNTKDSIQSSINFVPESSNFKPINLGNKVNSIYPELAPIISYDEKILFFTRNLHPDNYGEAKKYDVWVSTFDDDTKTFGEAVNIGRPINNDGANFVVSALPGNTQLILGNTYLPNGTMGKGISTTFTDGRVWSVPEEIKIDGFINLSKKGASYCVSSSGKKMILSVEDEDSKGGNDLYISFLKKDGSWTKPKNLGNVNTAENEETPFLAADEKTLYFATNGRAGFGENDIFVSRRIDDTWENWTEPINLGPNINTDGWDGYYTIPASGDFAYFVSNKNSFGNEDIFKIELVDSLKPSPVVLISGRVYSQKDSSLLGAKIIYEDLENGEEIGVAKSNPLTGEFKIVLPSGKRYGFLAQAEHYVAVNQNIDLRQITKFKEITTHLFLVPIEKGQTVRINNIFFDFGKSELLPESFYELNRLVDLMNENTKLEIEVQGHTDNIGSNERNKVVSQERANSVMNYLLSKGIAKERIHAVGFGKSNPITANDTEENRAKNRRVEFVIVNN